MQKSKENPISILFLDQSGKLGGAEISLTEIVKLYRNSCLVGLFSDGSFRHALEQQKIPVQILTTQPIKVQKSSGLVQSFSSLGSLVPLVIRVARIARYYSLIYANTQKALVVGALASFLARRPLIYHLRDILSPDHFSSTNRKVVIALANRFAARVIANSQASRAAFVEAGGRESLAEVIYNGFDYRRYQTSEAERDRVRQELDLSDHFVVGHFSRLSPWKGQHVLIDALKHCPEQVVALLVGDALFGEEDYLQELHQKVKMLDLTHRVKFLSFRTDIPSLMAACDLIAHTSIAPEPFGRVIIEGMLCSRPVVASAAGGAVELVESGQTGWLCPPEEPEKLAKIILTCQTDPEQAAQIAKQAQAHAAQQFNIAITNQQIVQLLGAVINNA